MLNRKLLSLGLALSFVFTFSIAMAADSNADNMEKIPSPDKIKEYTNITKEGTALYGIKKEIANKLREMNREVEKKMAETQKEISGQDTNADATTTSVSLEKIPSPDKIKEYTNITKEGTALYGIKKEIANKLREMNREVEKKMAETQKEIAKLEKILSPDKIKEYTSITKEGNTLYGIRKDNMGSGDKNESKPPVMVKRVAVTEETLSCVMAAIEAKDQALKDRISSASTELMSAISDRTTCQKEALKTTENQSKANEVCVEAFKEVNQSIIEKSKEIRDTAWKTYKESLKTCSPAPTSSTSESEGEIEVPDGGDSLEQLVQ